MTLDMEALILEDEYKPIGLRNLDTLLTYVASIIALAIGGVVFLILKDTAVAALMLMCILPLLYLIIRALSQPKVLIKYNKEGLLIFADKKERKLAWSDIISVDIQLNRRRLFKTDSGMIIFNALTPKEVKVDWLDDLPTLEASLLFLKEKSEKKPEPPREIPEEYREAFREPDNY